ncbi:HEAT repeat domain-containing protein [Sporolactobacillus kofuensis]|uniref:HEAT repeat domain-containing protein n=1 Tax=Sporolactobacillus kofuensis TaxID=269672 RepID=A0ABW1WFZ5_9BACL|nr:hypothetical protein [Sporolactobacillus kofuensis]MCO7175230.1 hypothetical protein [Sporolactobacillus kofuensis]
MFPLSIKIVVWSVITLFIILSVLFIILVVHKIYENNSQASVEQLKRKIQPLIFQNLFWNQEHSLEMYSKKRPFGDSILELVKEINNQFDLNSLNFIQSKTFEEYIVPVIKKRLGVHSWSERMNTLYLLESLGPAASWINLWQVYYRKHISRQEQYIILRINAQANDLRVISQLMTKPPYHSVYFYKQVISKMDGRLFKHLVDQFDECTQELRISILSVIGEKRELHYLPFVENHLSDQSMDIRIHALKTIRDFSYISKNEKLLPFANSDYWIEQMIFCQIAKGLKTPEYLPALKNLLTSRNWWVRHYSGEAIAHTPGGMDVLRKIAFGSKDKFAQDMADQWIQRAELNL